MLKFFRRIRQQLLNSGEMKKYSIYALGEIVLVVLGILIALQINNWNEGRKIKKLEKEYLVNQKEEYKNNANALQEVIQKRAKVVEYIDTLVFDSDAIKSKIDKQQWNKLVFSVHNYGEYVFTAKTPILNEIISSGNMVNITNPKLRTLLTLWDQKMSGVYGTQNEIKKYRDKAAEILSEHGLFNVATIANYGDIDFSPSQQKMGHQAIWKNNLILLRDEFLYLQNGIYPETKTYLQSVIALIESEIKK